MKKRKNRSTIKEKNNGKVLRKILDEIEPKGVWIGDLKCGDDF